MPLSNQCLLLPPGHPLAAELYDLQTASWRLMQPFIPGTPEHLQCEQSAAKLADAERALKANSDAMEFIFSAFRAECGADESCRVGLTTGADHLPIVDAQPPQPKAN